ncbi:uncharacterized protein LOC100837055 [Brachypodium distachyon]|uniref:Uncharacterized protein n=1 Tax=Brachypodium distachyon TaxID=15368 RepID=A0A0Q3IX15_BRADI|nr:uncharacterized protein LOC100837055 [Brachypodium distachyon]KQK10179.1 hypothetical protein BRADI_2g52480v3 [Brachypodium distachyon]|eukprot:XP_003564405.2 uncharacterized protein LOC100837055 [Brachypodium distachyon]
MTADGGREYQSLQKPAGRHAEDPSVDSPLKQSCHAAGLAAPFLPFPDLSPHPTDRACLPHLAFASPRPPDQTAAAAEIPPTPRFPSELVPPAAMELANHDLAALGAADLIRVSASIPRAAPRTFALLTACLVFPLSFAVLAHSLFTHPILVRIHTSGHTLDSHQWLALFAYQFVYAILLFIFSLLSTAAAVFTVASLYAAKPASISSSLAALPPILPRLLRTFLWVSLVMVAYNFAFVLTVFLLILFLAPSPATSPPSLSFVLLLLLIVFVFLAIHVYISALWHLASVITVLEPLCGLAAMSKSKQLLQGRTRLAAVLVFSYFAVCGVTAGLFRAAVVKGRGEEGSLGLSMPGRVLAGAVLVSVFVCVNLLGLLVQSVFYYACKAFHNQQIDRTALYEHLGGYLGEYVPLKSNIQMENL